MKNLKAIITVVLTLFALAISAGATNTTNQIISINDIAIIDGNEEWSIEELEAEIASQNSIMAEASEMAEFARMLGNEQSTTIHAAKVLYDEAKRYRQSLQAALNQKIDATYASPIDMPWEPLVRSEFGGRIDPISGKHAGHSGMDLAVPTGTEVHAVQSGIVVKSEYHYSYGNYIKIDHGNGLCTIYAHNSQLKVSVGDTVAKGDVIALSGSTGRSTGPHLHYEVRLNNIRVNPRDYLPSSEANVLDNFSDPVWDNTIEV